jgi:predicted RNA methylase
MSSSIKERLIPEFYRHLLNGGNYDRIIEARTHASQILNQQITPGHPLTKVVDEAMEAAIVRVAQSLVETAETTHQAYDRLVDLLERQPNLSVRSSTSVLQQAYSTPIPIAYLAATLAEINSDTTVYEPTAGHGSLLITANPENVTANEINSDRFAELATRSYHQLTQKDALIYRPPEQIDRVICNPPFGSVLDENQRVKRFPIHDTWTTQIDQVIALKALEVMKDDGKAVLILGGRLGNDEDIRSERYNTRESRAFHYLLYRQYNVTQHLSIWGDLYRKQGAGFPIDLIVIEGRGESQRKLPAAEVPLIYKSFAELKEQLPNEPLRQLSPTLGNGILRAAVRGQSARFYSQLGREDLQAANAGTAGLDDSNLDGGDRQPAGTNSGAVDNHVQSIELEPEFSLGDGRSSDVAESMGGSSGDRKRSLPRTPLPPGNQFPRDSSQQGRFRIPPPQRNSSRYPPGGVAPHPDSLTVQKDKPMDAESQPKQLPYAARSRGTTTDTLIPYNMASAAQSALDKFEQAHGNIDEYLTAKLGYASVNELHQYLCAEQVDAAALAISNLERGLGFITGDQTGVGKGRVCASILRYAWQQGKVAIFVTQKNTLYADMMRDVGDIGMYNFNPFATDSNAKIPLVNGQELRTGGAAQQEKTMREMIVAQGTGLFYNAVFTTYSQLQTVSNKEPLRRNFLRAIAPNAILILDEAHEAGGSSNGWSKSGPPDRADFVRELVDLSYGVFYSSATYAKRPDVMDLYARRTDLRLAVSNTTVLENILDRGGVPIQQIVASKFVASGQMLRRERSYEGISFQAKVVSVDREVADQFSAAMRAIKDFDKAKQKAIKELSKQLKQEAKAYGTDSTVGDVGAKSTNFTSLMHNCIEQGLLAQKAEATVQEALRTLQDGQKPVIAVANTMGSFIQGYADANDVQNGDRIDVSFSNLLERYLERSRDVLIKDYKGTVTRQRLTDAELGSEGVFAYEEALELIHESDFSSIPVSPIDHITQRLEREGYHVREVTGRSAAIDYLADGSTAYRVRSDSERTARARINAVAEFNSGDADVIILNCSGSTGISLHASERFADQRPRHMIVAQAERDINVFMQMLGRVHRTGQVALPSYTLLMGDLPAEKRPGAILCRKMAGLNANTTAARETDISISNVVDFMNPYGEQVIVELLSEDLALDAMLDFPLAQSGNDTSEIALIKRVTGRIPLLPIAEQEAVYSLIESEYQELVEQQRAMGESILEADQLDLDARTLAKMEVIPSQGQAVSEFTGAVYLEVVDVKSSAKPLTQTQVIQAVREELGLPMIQQMETHDRHQAATIAQQRSQVAITQLVNATQQYRDTIASQKQDETIAARFNEKQEKNLLHVRRLLQAYPTGTTVRIMTANKNNVLYGVVISVNQKVRSGSPAAPNSWKMKILVADSAKQIQIPFSKLNTGKEAASIMEAQSKDWFGTDIYELFDKRQDTARTTRQIFTGNLIAAFVKYPRGKLVNYTDNQGEVRQGLMMPGGFDIQESLQNEPVAFEKPAQVKTFLVDLTERRGAVRTLDEVLILRAQMFKDGFLLQAPRAKEFGGKYYLDEQIIAAVGSDFYSVGDRMEVVIPPDRLEQTLNVIMNQRGYALAVFDKDFKQMARDYLGVKLPELEVLHDLKLEQQTLVQERIPLEPELSSQPSKPPPATADRWVILPVKQQLGMIEKRIARFLEAAGIREAVTAGDDFHLKIENEPYIPLVVERHSDQLYLTHYLQQNGDTFIDCEMVFNIDERGRLQFFETASQDPLRGGEHRAPDRIFAQVFSKNILEQGFAEAALRGQTEVSQASARHWFLQIPHDQFPEATRSYLAVKAQHPDAIVLVKTVNELFYETYGEDARITSREADLLLTSKDLGEPVGRLTIAGFPVHAVDRFRKTLQENQTVVIANNQQDIQIYHKGEQNILPGAIDTLASNQQTQDSDGDGLTKAEELRFGTNLYSADTGGDGVSDSLKERLRQRQELNTHRDPLRRENSSTQWKELADRVRAYDLATVAAHLGLSPDPHDRNKWKDSAHTISLGNEHNESVFNDWAAGGGGRGAIDLVIHIQGGDYKSAVEWLSQMSSTEPIPQQTFVQYAAPKEPEPFHLPQPNEQKWNPVRQYLIEQRGLPEELIDRLHEINLVYADDKQNIVFPRHSNNGNLWERTAPTGANLRGTYGNGNTFHGLSPGSSREEGWFWLQSKPGEVDRIFVVESPIDAISLMVLDHERQKQHEGATVYLSSDGQGAMPIAALQSVLDQNGRVAAAFDTDKAGEAMAWDLAHELPGVMRATPGWGKDWNDRLLQREQADPVQETHRWIQDWERVGRSLGYSEQQMALIKQLQNYPTTELQSHLSPEAMQRLQSDRQQFNQSLKANWQWYGASVEAKKSDVYLNRVVEVAKEFNAGIPMSDRAIAERQKCIAQAAEEVTLPEKSLSLAQPVQKSRAIEVGG